MQSNKQLELTNQILGLSIYRDDYIKMLFMK